MEDNTPKGGEEGDNQINVSTTSQGQDSLSDDAKTLNQMEMEKQQSNKMKNLVSAVILLAGLFAGSLFVDAAQFLSGGGYSEKALKKSDIIEGGGKTWVAYTDPVVKARILTVSDEELQNCPKCDATEVVGWLKKFVPTVAPEKVDVATDAGEAIIKKYNIKTIPAFIFDEPIKDTDFYNGEAKILFEENQDKFVLNAGQLGVPIGKYLETPEVSQGDPAIGNPEAKVKMVIFSDFQCPYCKMFYTTATKVAKEYGDKIVLVYKEYPLDFHPQARAASMAAMCANEQGKYWQMADTLYNTQQEWGKTDKKDVYKTYAKRLGLDANKFDECLDGDKYTEKIDEDLALGAEYGISGTPSGFVGDEFIGGVAKEEELKQMIDQQLAK